MYPPATLEKLSEASIDFIRSYIDMTPANAGAPANSDSLPTEPPVQVTLSAEERRIANAPGGIGEKAFMEEKGKRVSTGFLVLLLARHRAMTIFAAGRSDFVAGGNGRCP